MEFLSYMILVPFICLVFYIIILGIILGSRRNKIAKHYARYIFSMIVWSLGSFVMKTNFPPNHLFWNRVLVTGLVFMTILFYHFTLVLTGTSKKTKTLVFGYFFTGVLLISNFLNLVTTRADVVNNVFDYEIGPMAPPMAIFGFIYLILALYNIIKCVADNEIPYVRVRLIIYGIILVIIGGLLNLVPDLGKYPIDIVLNTVNAIFIAYSIYRYRFLEIKLIVKKGMAYTLYTLILSLIYLIAIYGVQSILSDRLGIESITMTLLSIVPLVMLLQPIKNLIQRWIDKIFYKDKMMHQTIINEFSRGIIHILEMKELTESLTMAINKGIKPKNVHLAIREANGGFQFYDSPLKNKKIDYNDNHPIIKWLNNGNSYLTLKEIECLPFFTSLWSLEKKQFYDMETELIVPIKFREQITGLVILSEKRNGEVYSQSEIELLYTLLNNASVVIENASMYELAKHEAITDGLTKLYNHRYFHETLTDWLNESKYDVFSIAMIDVDHFKFYNDLHGHSVGDKALMKIASILKESCYEDDIVARYGGEEFAILMPNVEGEDSLKIIERIRRTIENRFSSESSKHFVTISVGVASYPKHGDTGLKVIDCADNAMYAAKNTGRNKAILYTSKDNDNEFDVSDDVKAMQDTIKSAYLSSIYALAATIDAKDKYTYGHSENVSRFAVEVAKELGFDDNRTEIIKNAGLLHDIGKIGIPENILSKKERLTNDEYEIMKKHVDIAIDIIKHVPNILEVIPGIMSHHERYDGKGYPRGIKGENIPIEGRILSVVDAFDAMISDRPYRESFSVDEALKELENNVDTQFDARITKVFVKLVKEHKISNLDLVIERADIIK
ncbi:diguanylate cyclase [Mycoplasmatota bacterium WC44]